MRGYIVRSRVGVGGLTPTRGGVNPQSGRTTGPPPYQIYPSNGSGPQVPTNRDDVGYFALPEPLVRTVDMYTSPFNMTIIPTPFSPKGELSTHKLPISNTEYPITKFGAPHFDVRRSLLDVGYFWSKLIPAPFNLRLRKMNGFPFRDTMYSNSTASPVLCFS